MNKAENEENILKNISGFAKYENPNNFDDYHAELISQIFKIFINQ